MRLVQDSCASEIQMSGESLSLVRQIPRDVCEIPRERSTKSELRDRETPPLVKSTSVSMNACTLQKACRSRINDIIEREREKRRRDSEK